MKKDYLAGMAVFMIFLIISLPFYIADAHALLQLDSISGEQEFNHFRRSSDYTSIIVRASRDGLPVGIGDLTLTDRTEPPYVSLRFTSCAESGDDYLCEYISPVYIIPKTKRYEIKLGGETIGPSEAFLHVDGTPPTITSSTITQDGNRIIFQFSATDPNDAATGKCSGIKRAEFLEDVSTGYLTVYDSVEYSPQLLGESIVDCSSGSQRYEIPLGEGFAASGNFCLYVYDGAGNRNEHCENIFVDTKRPVVTDINLYYSTGQEIVYLGTEPIIDAYLNITIEDPELTEVWVDLSDFIDNPAYKQAYSALYAKSATRPVNPASAGCNADGDAFNCWWKVSIQTLDPILDLKINARDSSGNSIEGEASIVMQIDTQKPKTLFIGTDYCNQDRSVCFIKEGRNLFIAEIQEEGSGLNNNQVFFDLSQVFGDARAHVVSCDYMGAFWSCWGYHTISQSDLLTLAPGQQRQISIVYPSSDDAGNPVESKAGIIIADSSPPVVRKINIKAEGDNPYYFANYIFGSGKSISTIRINQQGVFITGDTLSRPDRQRIFPDYELQELLGAEYSNVPSTVTVDEGGKDVTYDLYTPKLNRTLTVKSGDILAIEVNVYDLAGIVSAKADFTEFTERTILDGSCFKDSPDKQTYTCQWFDTGKVLSEIMGRQVRGQEHNIKFTFTDLMGHQKNVTLRMPIYYNEDVDPAYYSGSTVECMNEGCLIDKELLSIMGIPSYHTVKLLPRSGYSVGSNLNPMRIELATCKGSGMAYISTQFPLVWFLPNSDTAYVQIPLAAASVEEDVSSIEFDCKMKVVSLVNNQRISKPENVEANITINFYNAPLGEISEAVRDEIAKVKSSSLVSGEWIGMLDTVFKLLSRGCSTIRSIITGWNIITGVYAVASAAQGTGFLTSLVEVLRVSSTAGGVLTAGTEKIMKPACAIASCTVWEELKIEPLQTWNTWMDIGTGRALQQGWMNKTFGEKFAAQSMPSPEESLFISLIKVCLPGVISNLQKARNIECKYITCLRDDVADGVPIFICAAQRSYGWCTYVWGQVFEIMPFTALVQNLGNILGEMAKGDMVSLITTAGGIYCAYFPNAVQSSLCMLQTTIKKVGDIVETIKGLTEWGSYWQLNDYCPAALGDGDGKEDE